MSLMDDVTGWIAHPTSAGVLGSLLSLRWAPGTSWVARAFAFGCGIGCAVYGAPALVEYMQIKSAWAPPAFHFLSGVLGMNLLAKAVDVVKNTDWVSIFQSFKGRKSE